MSNPGEPTSKSSDNARQITEVEWEQVRQSLNGLSFGSVSIVVQDGVIVQIDRTEKRRIRRGEVGPRPPSQN